MGLRQAIGGGPVGLDTAAFIYFIEEHPAFLRLVEPIFAAVDAGRLTAFTSSLTLSAHRGLRTPVAIQLSAALSGGCPIFVTNDRALPAVPGLRVLQLKDYLGV